MNFCYVKQILILRVASCHQLYFFTLIALIIFLVFPAKYHQQSTEEKEGLLKWYFFFTLYIIFDRN